MKKTIWIAAALLAGAALASAQQKIDVKTGLWEVTTVTDASGMPPIDLSKLPPDARAKVEAMMKAKQASGPQTHTTKSCLTEAKLEKDLFSDEQASCKRTVISSTPTNIHMKVECTGPRKTSGEGEFTATSRESATGWFKLLSTDGTNTMTVNTKITSKWLGASCGDVK